MDLLRCFSIVGGCNPYLSSVRKTIEERLEYGYNQKEIAERYSVHVSVIYTTAKRQYRVSGLTGFLLF